MGYVLGSRYLLLWSHFRVESDVVKSLLGPLCYMVHSLTNIPEFLLINPSTKLYLRVLNPKQPCEFNQLKISLLEIAMGLPLGFSPQTSKAIWSNSTRA
jgi:hypothetical protein